MINSTVPVQIYKRILSKDKVGTKNNPHALLIISQIGKRHKGEGRTLENTIGAERTERLL